MSSSDTDVFEKISVIKTIGTGTFGRVCLCYDKENSKYVAVKIMAIADIVRCKQVDHVRNEISILSEINHPFIIELLNFIIDKHTKCLYMVLDYICGGELFSYLRNAKQFESETAKFYASEIILALEYLHSLSIVYRDLKPENVLLDGKGHVKLTDFGFSKKIKDRAWSLCGTTEYLSPEVIQSKGHNKSVDWWALGILIYEMLVGSPPFKHSDQDDTPYDIYDQIVNSKIDWPKNIDCVAKDLVKKLLKADRTQRLGCMRNGAEDVKNHRWFRDLNWNDVYNKKYTPPIVPHVENEIDTSNFDEYQEINLKEPVEVSDADLTLFDDLLKSDF